LAKLSLARGSSRSSLLATGVGVGVGVGVGDGVGAGPGAGLGAGGSVEIGPPPPPLPPPPQPPKNSASEAIDAPAARRHLFMKTPNLPCPNVTYRAVHAWESEKYRSA